MVVSLPLIRLLVIRRLCGPIKSPPWLYTLILLPTSFSFLLPVRLNCCTTKWFINFSVTRRRATQDGRTKVATAKRRKERSSNSRTRMFSNLISPKWSPAKTSSWPRSSRGAVGGVGQWKFNYTRSHEHSKEIRLKDLLDADTAPIKAPQSSVVVLWPGECCRFIKYLSLFMGDPLLFHGSFWSAVQN